MLCVILWLKVALIVSGTLMYDRAFAAEKEYSHVPAEACPFPNVSSRVLSVLSQLATRTGEATGMPLWSHTLAGARVDGAGRLEVMIQTTETTAGVLKELEARGSSIEIYDAAQNLVQAWIPPEQIREIAALPFVRFLDLPNYGVTD